MGQHKPETKPRDRHAVTPEAMRSYAQVLRTIADNHDQIAAQMEQHKLPYIDAGNVKTGVEGIHLLSKFLAAATTALVDNVAGAGMVDFEGAVAHLKAISRRVAASTENSKDAPVFPSRGEVAVDTPEEIEDKAQTLLAREKSAVQDKQHRKGGRATNHSG